MIEFKNPYWTKEMQISHLERRIIIYSIAYYEMDETIVSDTIYESISNQLLEMIKKHKNDFRESEYYYIFFDYDGDTGFHLCGRMIEKDKSKLIEQTKKILEKQKYL